MKQRDRDELLAWYVNGTLDEAERREVEAWIETDPNAQLALAELEFMQETVSEVSADEPELRSNLFDELLTRIDAEEQRSAQQQEQPVTQTLEPQAEVTPPRRPATPSWSERLQTWFEETFQWGMTPAFARIAVVSQFAVVVALGGLLLLPGSKEEGFEVLSGSPATATMAGITADIGVVPDLAMGEFQQLLQQHQAVVVDGPSGIGIYRIRLANEAQAESSLKALAAHPSVVYLQRVSP